MVVGQDCLTARSILPEISNMLDMSRQRFVTYNVVVTAVNDVSTAILEVYTVAIDERSCG